MTGNKSFFYELDETFFLKVIFSDDSIIDTKDIGKIPIQTKEGSFAFIVNIIYVPKLKSNLLSLGQFMEKSYEIYLKNKYYRIKDRNR